MEWENAPPGTKHFIIKTWASALGISVASVYRCIPDDIKGIDFKKRNRRIDGIEDYAKLIATIKKRPPKGRREIVTEDAITLAKNAGLIPEGVNLGTGTMNRVLKEMDLRKNKRRVMRFQADYPNQLHHIDASSSSCFYVDRSLPDGDYVLKLDARQQKNYKNKIVKHDRLRPWIYGLVDDHSGYSIGRYVAAPGESLADNLSFLAWAWAKNDDKPFFGLPDWLKADFGPMMKGKAAQDFIEKLQIKIDPSMPYAKEAHGKIERPWRSVWVRFETPFYSEDHKTFEISLGELNRRFLRYCEVYNNKDHRTENISRLNSWQKINYRGGAVAIPENAIATVARRYERTVALDGTFSIDNMVYEVEGNLADAKVYVYKGVFEDKLTAVNQLTGEKYGVKPFKASSFHEYRAFKETPCQKAEKAAQEFSLPNTLYQDPNDAANVTRFPTRIKETRIIENQLETSVYPSMEAAMHDFISICGFRMFNKHIEAVKGLIMKNGLSIRFVKELALEVQAENERIAQNG